MRRIAVTAIGVAIGIIVALVGMIILSRAGSSSWRYTQSLDPMTDAPTAAAYISSDDGAEMELSCTAGSAIGLTIKAPRRLTSFSDGGKPVDRVVNFRFDDGPIQDTVGVLLDDMIGFPRKAGKSWDERILSGLGDADTLAIQTVDSDSDDVRYLFPSAGAQDMMEQVREGCKGRK